MTIDKKRLNEIVPVSHPIFWFGTILAQKSNNKNYSNNAKTNQVELISSCYHNIIQTKRTRLRYLLELFLDKLLQTHSLQILRFLENRFMLLFLVRFQHLSNTTRLISKYFQGINSCI